MNSALTDGVGAAVPAAAAARADGIGAEWRTGIVLRSAALFVILYQFRLLADGLADTAVYVAALLGAFGAAAFLACRDVRAAGGAMRKMGPLEALAAIALIPWASRALIALPRILIPGSTDSAAIALDALLLGFDRNNFVSLLPFYWAAATTWLSIRSRRFLRGAVVADALLLIAVFAFAPVANIGVYRWPVVVISVVAGAVFLQALALLFSLPRGAALRAGEKASAIAALALLAFLGGLAFLGPAQARAASRGGGLLEPRGLFSFDFSQVLGLSPEISMSDDLVLIARKYPSSPNALLRRVVMSGFDRRQGFFRVEELDERTHPHRVPNRPTELPDPGFASARRISQEFFIVNFEATALIGMKQPVEVIPFEAWDASSFRAAYAVESMVVDFSLGDFILERGGAWPTLEDFGLGEREFGIYTYYGGDERLRAFAREITDGYGSFHEKVLAIYAHLKFGEYRYSLRPGIAPDGDQLAWFLFYSKRGYCTYFAFAMTLMLRSLGIPARVAAGFLVDPASSVFNYYAIRADMAHAWVEVLFPGSGWIEFDPTTYRLAEGEDFAFSPGVDPDLFERLMREILENREQMRVRMGPDADGAFAGAGPIARAAAEALRRAALPLALAFAAISFALARCGFLLLCALRRERRAKAAALWRHARMRLALAGMRRPPSLAESEWAARCDSAVGGTYGMYLASAAARFAPSYGEADFDEMRGSYGVFSASCKSAVPRWRRLLAWALPPLALALPAKPSAGKISLALLLLLAFAAAHDGGAQGAGIGAELGANELFAAAAAAERAENWERAISLYREGGARFPDDIRFPWALGSLYYGRSLYGLALDEFRRAEAIDPYDTGVLHGLASAAGFLNMDHASVAYLERLLAIDPDDRFAISRLGWMYFKVHRLADGERLLADAIARLGESADFAMTLGTIYAAMFRLDEGRHWYLRSIAMAAHDPVFRAVAHYNLSILEARFFRHGPAMDQAGASLAAHMRASGFLSRGDLLARQMDLRGAMADFVQARETDTSPLSKVNIARVHLMAGRLNEARLYAHSSLRVGDHAWMAHFGINPDRYRRDVHEILYNVYSGLSRAERFSPSRTPFQAIASRFRSASHRFSATVHRKLFQKYSLASGDAHDRGGRDAGGFAGAGENRGAPPIDRYFQFFSAFRSYPRRAALYLRRARSFEAAIIPASIASYDLEEGRLLGDLRMTAAALGGLDPVWQRDLIALAYAEFARGAGTRIARQSFAEELFALNRGALLQSGIALPAEVNARFVGMESLEGRAARDARRAERVLRGALEKAGFAAPAGAPRFRLDVEIRREGALYGASVSLVDAETRDVVFSKSAGAPRSLSRADIYAFAADLGRAVFRAD